MICFHTIKKKGANLNDFKTGKPGIKNYVTSHLYKNLRQNVFKISKGATPKL